MFVSSVLWMVPASLLIGLSIAPTLIAGNGLIAQIMPEETRTEGFSWESASINVGAALGSALAGVSVDVLDVRAGFGIGPVAAALGCSSPPSARGTSSRRGLRPP